MMSYRQAQRKAARDMTALLPYTGKDVERCYACGDTNLQVEHASEYRINYFTIKVKGHLVVTCLTCKYSRRRAMMCIESVAKKTQKQSTSHRASLRLRD